MMLRRHYLIVADLSADGKYIGSVVRGRFFTRTMANRALKKKYECRDYTGSSVNMIHKVWSADFWDHRPECVNTKFFCAGCAKDMSCANLLKFNGENDES